MAETNQQQAAAQKAADDLRKNQEAARKEAAAGVDARLKVKDQQVKASQERHDNMQPTPTQRENDLARVGALDLNEEKDDDGSEWETDHTRRVAAEKLDNPYVDPAVAAETTKSKK